MDFQTRRRETCKVSIYPNISTFFVILMVKTLKKSVSYSNITFPLSYSNILKVMYGID